MKTLGNHWHTTKLRTSLEAHTVNTKVQSQGDVRDDEYTTNSTAWNWLAVLDIHDMTVAVSFQCLSDRQFCTICAGVVASRCHPPGSFDHVVHITDKHLSAVHAACSQKNMAAKTPAFWTLCYQMQQKQKTKTARFSEEKRHHKILPRMKCFFKLFEWVALDSMCIKMFEINYNFHIFAPKFHAIGSFDHYSFLRSLSTCCCWNE